MRAKIFFYIFVPSDQTVTHPSINRARRLILGWVTVWSSDAGDMSTMDRCSLRLAALRPLDLIPLVTLFRVSTKLEVSMAFLFR